MAKQLQLIIRTATDGDLDAVADLWHASATSMDGAPVDVPPRDQLRMRIDAELRQGWNLRVAVAGARIVGMLAIKRADAILDQIFVAPLDQGAGVGAALMDAAKQAMPNGFSLRMDASNASARRFYEREGLKRVGAGVHPHTGIPVHFYRWEKS